MRILGTYHCGKELLGKFKRQRKQHDDLCRSDCLERIVSSFDHQIKSEYYGGNWSISIEVIGLENFSASNQSSSSLKPEAVSQLAVFH